MVIFGQWSDALCLRVLYRYRLANAVPLDGTASYAEIAAASGLKESLCKRFIRIAIEVRIFDEDPNTERIRHTAASRQLVVDQDLCDALGLQLDDIGPASTRLVDVWEKYGQDVAENTRSAFCMYNETDKPLYEFFATHPERGQRFGNAMRFFTKRASWDLRHILSSFEWNSVDKPGDTVIDLAGGNGQVSQYLAWHTKNTRFVVQDLPHVVSSAPSQLPEDLEERVSFMTHDFFTPQKADDAPNAYFLRWILHNYNDKHAIQT